MKKISAMTIILSAGLLIGLALSGCGNTASSKLSDENSTALVHSALSDETALDTALSEDFSDRSIESVKDTIIVQGGPYGQISLSIPDGWDYETFPIDNGELFMGLYGIRFYPQDAASGYIELDYTDSFGVCGTGLQEEQTVIAGKPATVGTYDNNTYWDFISFLENHSGIVALTYNVADWWNAYCEQVTDILNTLSFDSSIKEGGAYIYSDESHIDKIHLSLSLKNISPAGATLIFNQYNADTLTDDLSYGDNFILESQQDHVWEEVPIILEDDYGFHDIAYVIPSGGTSEQELNWEWLYGKLAPGTYRIQKSIIDSKEPGDFDKYTIYAQFILN